MEKWLDILLKTGVTIFAVSLIYVIITYIFTKRTIFKTVTSASPKNAGEVMAYYYLPVPIIKVTAFGKAEIFTETGTNTFMNAILREQRITAVTETVPDTSHLLLIKYTGSSFANDDVKITVNAMGLLDNVASVSEDRFSNIISTLVGAPGKALQKEGVGAVREDVITVTSEIKEYTKEFTIAPEKITEGTEVPFAWKIDVPDKTNAKDKLDASFKIKFTSPFTASITSVITSVINYEGNGIYVRPPIVLHITVSPDGNNTLQKIDDSGAALTIPDVSKTLLIPVTRAMMVKKTQGLKLQNGMLLENAITKPSESEAIIAIPVNLLKAIFSIPSQLLSFRITRIQQQKNLVTEESAMSKAILDSEKAKLGSEAELTKAKLEAQKTIISFEQDLLKAKMETQKNLIDAEKNTVTAQKEVIKAQQDLLQAQHDLTELRKKLSPPAGTQA